MENKITKQYMCTRRLKMYWTHESVSLKYLLHTLRLSICPWEVRRWGLESDSKVRWIIPLSGIIIFRVRSIFQKCLRIKSASGLPAIVLLHSMKCASLFSLSINVRMDFMILIVGGQWSDCNWCPSKVLSRLEAGTGCQFHLSVWITSFDVLVHIISPGTPHGTVLYQC